MWIMAQAHFFLLKFDSIELGSQPLSGPTATNIGYLKLLMLFYIFGQNSVVLRHLTSDNIMSLVVGAADDSSL